MEEQHFQIQGRVYRAEDDSLQDILARAYAAGERPRCVCVAGGLDMYIARLARYVVKRMPDSGHLHHPTCPSYAPEPGHSGLSELMGEAIVEASPEHVDLHFDFPLIRMPGRIVPRAAATESSGAANSPRRRMSLRALMHLLWERAGFNRWVPAMQGKRSWAVLRHYLLESAQEFKAKGMPLADFLHLPERFRPEQAAAIAQRRRDELASLHDLSEGGALRMMVVIGEFKAVEPSTNGRRLWLKHMPDCPLFIDEKTWLRAERVFNGLIEAREADPQAHLRLVVAALIHAKGEFTFRIDTLSLMLTTAEWIPVTGVPEAQLIAALVRQSRWFLKPLRYDVAASATYSSALLLDTGRQPTALRVLSVFADPRDQATKRKAVGAGGAHVWTWDTRCAIPTLPVPVPRAGRESGAAAANTVETLGHADARPAMRFGVQQ